MRGKRFYALFFLCSAIVFCSTSLGYSQEKSQHKERLVSCVTAYHWLKTRPNTYLIDVRTRYEYQVVGHPVGAYNFPYKFFSSQIGRSSGGKVYYKKVKNPDFIKELKKKFGPNDVLLLICRSGHRSKMALEDLMSDGYFKEVYSVEGGFEGSKLKGEDEREDELLRRYSPNYEHRIVNGWRYLGLPWTYDVDLEHVYPPDARLQEKRSEQEGKD